MSRKNKFIENINLAKVEKDLELIYKSELCYYYKDAKISNPYNSDGLIESGKLKLIMELKYDKNLQEKSVQCETLIQALYYISKQNLSTSLPISVTGSDPPPNKRNHISKIIIIKFTVTFQ